MSSKRSGMEKEKETVTPDSSDSGSESDEIQQPQTVEPKKVAMSNTAGQRTMENSMTFEPQLTVLNGPVEVKYQMINNKLEHQLKNTERNANASENIGHGEENIAVDESFLDQLPLKSVKDVENFDTIISESPEKFNSLVKRLYKIGSDGNENIIYNMMRFLMSDDAACIVLGKSSYPSFKRLKLYNAITDARKRTMPTFTEKEMEIVLSDYLTSVKSRISRKEEEEDDIK